MPQYEHSSRRPELPLSMLLDEPSFGAELLSPAASDTEAVRAVRERGFAHPIVIELVEPTPYLTPGDLLLITGLGLPSDDEGLAKYVASAKAAGAVGLVMGLEPVYSAVPPGLVAACLAQEMPLVQLPPPVYFASVIAFVARSLESQRLRSLSAMVTTAQHLTEATMQHDPLQQLLAVLARERGGWAVLRIGEDLHTAGALPKQLDLDTLLEDLTRRLEPQLRQKGTPTAFATVTVGDEHPVEFEVTAHLARNPQRSAALSLLAFGKSPNLDTSDRTALLLATSLVSMLSRLPAEQTLAVDQLLMHFLIDATSSAVTGRERARVTGLLGSALGSGAQSAHAVIAERHGEHAPAVGFTDVAWLRRLLRTPLVEQRGRRLRAFTARPPDRAELEQATAEGWVLAISRERALAELPHAMYEAEELSRTAKRLGRHVGGHDLEELSKVWPLAAITDPLLGEAAANLWLAPLDGEEFQAERAALAAWLQRHGSWDRTARDLALHRNTVRRLIATAGERLGRDLDDPVERARLLLAFTVTDPAP